MNKKGNVGALFGVMVAVLLVAVIGIALRETIVGNLCSLTDSYAVDYTYNNGTADVSKTEIFAASGINCDTMGLIYTWGLVLIGLGSIVGLIYQGVAKFRG